MELKEIIHKRRIELGLTLEEIGNCCGVTKTTVMRWENGEASTIKLSMVEKLASILRLDPSVFINESYGVEDEVEAMAERLHKNPELRMLFDRAADATPEQLQICADMLEQFKKASR